MLCKQMKPYFSRFSSMPQFRKAVFAEVEVDSVEVRGPVAAAVAAAAVCFRYAAPCANLQGGACVSPPIERCF